MEKKVLITGGAGFVGQNLVQQLLKENYKITITSTGSEAKIDGIHKVLYTSLDGIDWSFVNGQDAIVHLMANNDTLCDDRDEMMRANFYGPIKLFHKAYDGGCRKFVYASSTAVYGNSPAPYTTETKVAPLNVYGESKAKFDEFAMNFAKEKSVSVIGLRFCNIYGPGEDKKGKRMSMIGQLIKTVQSKKSIVLFKNGQQRRDWVHVNDVVQSIMLSMNTSSNCGEIYNLGSGKSYTFNEVAETVQQELGSVKEIQYVDCPFLDKYQSYTECDIEKARKELGYCPKYNLRSGVKQYLEHLI